MPKNGYFQHDHLGHRLLQQVWNVKVLGAGDMSIWVQGGTAAGFARDTNFAKKHLLTFKGGDAATNKGKERDKMLRIWNKRRSPNNPLDPHRVKYGAQVNQNGINTMIRCDRFTDDSSDPASLPQIFGMAMWTPIKKSELDLSKQVQMGTAAIELSYDQIWEAHEIVDQYNPNAPAQFKVETMPDAYKLYQIKFGFNKMGNHYQIVHLEGMHVLG